MKSLHKIYAVVDLETTGASYRKGHRIFQIGITMIQHDQLMQEYSFTINPEKVIPPMIENLTGIRNADVKHAPYFEDVAPYIYGLLEDCVFVAHNIAFDYHFLNQSFEAVGLPKMTQKGIDTVELTKILFPTLKSYRLSDLSEHFGFEHKQAHDAASDAKATAELFLRLKEKAIQLPLTTLEKLSALADYTQRDNGEFLELCLELAREEKQPLPANLTIENGLALIKKNMGTEQTAYRIKEEQPLLNYLKKPFLDRLNFEERPSQQMMSQQIEHFLNETSYSQLAIQAIPGMGKTLAYLLPAILAADPSKKVIISTSTLLLQEQLAKSIHELQEILPFSFVFSSLSSKNHLLNLENLEKIDMNELTNTEVLILMSIYVWLTETITGDVTELSSSHHTGSILERVTYQAGEAPITEKWQAEDFLRYHENKAKSASILITNHSYLAYHYERISALSEQQLPHLIIDEAHRFPLVFQEQQKKVFSFSGLKKRINRFALDIRNYREYLEVHATNPFPQYELLNFEFALDQLYDTLVNFEAYVVEEFVPSNVFSGTRIEKQQIYLDSEMLSYGTFFRYIQFLSRQMDEVIFTSNRYLEELKEENHSSIHRRIINLQKVLKKNREILAELVEIEPYAYFYFTYEGQHDFFQGEIIKEKWYVGEEIQQSFIPTFDQVLYISATLLQDNKIDYFSKKIGVTELPASSYPVREVSDRQPTYVIVPKDLKNLNEIPYDEWIKSISCFMIDILEKYKQKVMVLFSANQALEDVYRDLRQRVEQKNMSIDILAQGFSGSNRRMHRRFLEAEQAVLLGSGMYWEGIDFPENPVDLLIIPRLPFDSPSTPENLSIQKHYDQIRKNAFREEMLPKMLTRLAQGIGRVSRNEEQKGMVICLDSRIINSSYAKEIQKSLPSDVTIVPVLMDNLSEEMDRLKTQEGGKS